MTAADQPQGLLTIAERMFSGKWAEVRAPDVFTGWLRQVSCFRSTADMILRQ